MTSGERKALLFLAGIGVLGAGARLVTAPAHPPAPAERVALDRQLGAVDSARHAPKGTRPAPAARAPRARRRAADAPPPPPAERPVAVEAAGPIDVDVADVAALDALPGIGPALAARIVADRMARGTFGSLAGLQQVRGVGPKLAARLASRVTFSGVSRPSIGTRDSGLAARNR